jgi:hypothetical protein
MNTRKIREDFKKLKLWKKFVAIIIYTILLAFIILLIFGFPYIFLVHDRFYKVPGAWIAVLIGATLGILFSILWDRWDKLKNNRLIVIPLAITILILGSIFYAEVSNHWAFFGGAVVYFYILGISGFILTIKGNPKVNLNKSALDISIKPGFFNVVLPSYIPNGYIEKSIDNYKKRNVSYIELIYNHTQGNIVWIVESNGPNAYLEPRKNMFKSDVKIKGVTVHLEHELTRKTKQPKSLNLSQFFETNWEWGGLYFNFRADSLNFEQVEKIISSMIS